MISANAVAKLAYPLRRRHQRDHQEYPCGSPEHERIPPRQAVEREGYRGASDERPEAGRQISQADQADEHRLDPDSRCQQGQRSGIG